MWGYAAHMSVVIGPPATRLLFENDDVKIWMMDVAPGETYPHHYHDYDYVLFYTTDVLATVHDDAPEEHTALWNARYDHGTDGEAPHAGIWTYAHSVFFIPGTGFLSPGFVNIGDTPMVSPLIEVKRPRRPDQDHIGFARSDALVGLAPNGTAHLLENDRLRVSYTTLAPGAGTGSDAHRGSAVCVIDGASLVIDSDGSRREEEHRSQSAYWRDGAVRRLSNIGTTVYREISVELK
jgi:quercetin dioxygenase-like cupin family protein